MMSLGGRARTLWIALGCAVVVGSALVSTRDRRAGVPAGGPGAPAPAAEGADGDEPAAIVVRDEDGRPVVGATLYWKFAHEREFLTSETFDADGRAVISSLGPDEPGLDVLVTCPGRRSVRLRDVRSVRTVVLVAAKRLRVTIRLGEGVPPEVRAGPLVAWLEWYPDDEELDPREFEPVGRKEFGAERELEIEVDDAGRYLVGIGTVTRVRWRGQEAEAIRRSLRPYPSPPFVHVPEGDSSVEFVVQDVRD